MAIVLVAGPAAEAASAHRPPPVTASPTAVAPRILFSDDFSGYVQGLGWTDGTVHGKWISTYNGFGLNGITLATGPNGFKTNVASESPKAATTPGETHAGLLVSSASVGDMDLTVAVRTLRQLRTPTPNNWETAWVLWHFTAGPHFYYFIPKAHGWELGKSDPAYPGGQRFLATGTTPSYPLGNWYSVRVRQVASTFSVWVNGSLVATFTDNERPYLSGQLGLYSEDAKVQFDNVTVVAP
jgi:hypothetical protein